MVCEDFIFLKDGQPLLEASLVFRRLSCFFCLLLIHFINDAGHNRGTHSAGTGG